MGVRMAGWVGPTGLRSWWCDGGRGPSALSVLGQPWPNRRRQGPRRRDEKGKAQAARNLASGMPRAACSIAAQKLSLLLPASVCLAVLWSGMDEWASLTTVHWGLAAAELTQRGCSGCICKIT